MNQNHLFSLLLSLFLLGVLTSPAPAETIDFKNLKSEKSSNQFSALQENRLTLWNGSARSLYFEIGSLGGKLLTVSATSQQIFVSTGQNLNLLEGNLQRRIPGRILYLDLHSIPDKRNYSVVTVTYLSQQTLKSSVYTLRKDNGNLQLNSFYTTNWSLVRPVADKMYRQQYDPNRGWSNSIESLETTLSSYKAGSSLDIPSDLLLSALTGLTENRWASLTTSGELVLNQGPEKLAQVEGTFGATVDRIQAQNPDSSMSKETTLRLPPVHLQKQGLLAVTNNREPTQGLMSWIYGSNPRSFLEVFGLEDDTLEYRGSIGPLRGRILDVEAPVANPNQLLFLRRYGKETVTLEMIDFGDSGNPNDARPSDDVRNSGGQENLRGSDDSRAYGGSEESGASPREE